MVNVQRLKGEVKANGFTTAEMAKKMGISTTTLDNLYAGRTQFKVNHIEDFTRILKLSSKQRDDIFFANQCPEMGTRP